MFLVWVGGVDVEHSSTYEGACNIARWWIDDGFDDVVIEKVSE